MGGSGGGGSGLPPAGPSLARVSSKQLEQQQGNLRRGASGTLPEPLLLPGYPVEEHLGQYSPVQQQQQQIQHGEPAVSGGLFVGGDGDGADGQGEGEYGLTGGAERGRWEEGTGGHMSAGEDGLVTADTGAAAAAEGQLMPGGDLEGLTAAGGGRMQLRSAAAAAAGGGGGGVGDVEAAVLGGGPQRKTPSMLEMLLGSSNATE